MAEQNWLIPFAEFQAAVASAPERAYVGLRHGTMRTLLYAPPRGQDTQTPHTQDELYIVQTGRGVFRKGDETRPFGPGDVIFVEAGAEHQFENFSDDFAVYAIFWGPKGGEP